MYNILKFQHKICRHVLHVIISCRISRKLCVSRLNLKNFQCNIARKLLLTPVFRRRFQTDYLKNKMENEILKYKTCICWRIKSVLCFHFVMLLFLIFASSSFDKSTNTDSFLQTSNSFYRIIWNL